MLKSPPTSQESANPAYSEREIQKEALSDGELEAYKFIMPVFWGHIWRIRICALSFKIVPAETIMHAHCSLIAMQPSCLLFGPIVGTQKCIHLPGRMEPELYSLSADKWCSCRRRISIAPKLALSRSARRSPLNLRKVWPPRPCTFQERRLNLSILHMIWRCSLLKESILTTLLNALLSADQDLC